MTAKQEQPEWLKETVSGLTTSRLYRVFMEGRRYAVVHCPGNNGYVDRMTGVKYAPSEYVLVEKGKNFWSHTWKTLHRGRLTKETKAVIEKALAEAEGR